MRGKRVKTSAACVAAVLAMTWGCGPQQQPAPRPATERAEGAGQLYTCSMHPHVIRSEPGSCPICGMNLTPLQGEAAPDGEDGPEGVRVSRGFRQNFSVRTTVVRRTDLPARIRTIGYLDWDEGSIVSVTVKTGGWIEKSRVSTVGERIEEGGVLFEIYSPQLLTAQDEYLAAKGYAARLRELGARPDAVSRADSLAAAARQRLRHWDLTPPQIDRLDAEGRARRTLEVHAPAGGQLAEKVADSLDGLWIAPGAVVLKIADSSALWAKAEFYEHQLGGLKAGLRADISLDAFPGRRWRGKLLFFEPSVSPQTQTLTGYVAVSNAGGRLRPKMYATVEIELEGERNALAVPVQAVLRTGGDRAAVIVAAGEGRYVPRPVQLGLESEGLVRVTAGLKEGERIVTSSQFLLDSESSLQAALERLADPAEDAGGDAAR